MSSYDDYLFVDREKKLKGFQKLLLPQTKQAVMVIEAPPDMGKTWLVGKIHQLCRQPKIDLPVAHIDFRNPREIHEIQGVLQLLRLLRRKLGHDSYFNYLNATINALTITDISNQGSGEFAGLRQKIESAFNLDELRGLCFDLDINYDKLPGEALERKTLELIAYCRRRSLLTRLMEQCLMLRPNLDWWQGLEALRDGGPDEAVTAVTTDSAAFITDDNTLLRVDSEMERQHAERQINAAFFECLAALLADKQPAVFLFDSFEAAPPEAQSWILREFLPRLQDENLKDVVIIMTGRKTPDLTDLPIKPLVVETQLDPFIEADIREYFEERRKIMGLDLRTVILTSGGVPGALAMMADHAMITAEDDDDFFSDL
jgi:hypothetical protein